MAPRETFFGNGLQIYLFIVVFWIVLFSLGALIFLVYRLYKHEKKLYQKPSLNRRKSIKDKLKINIKIVNYPTIASVLSYFISSVSLLIALHHFDDDDANNFSNDKGFVHCIISFVTFLFLAKLSIHTQFLSRLYVSFKGSYLESNKSTIRISITLLCLAFIAIIWWIILLTVRYLIKFEHDAYYTQFYFIFGLLFVCDFSLSWLVVGLFINKLFASVMLQDRTEFFDRTSEIFVNDDDVDDDNSLSGSSSKTSSIKRQNSLLNDVARASMDDKDMVRLDLITKQFILSFISIGSAQIAIVTLLIILLFKLHYGFSGHTQTILYCIYAGAIYPIDITLNCIVLYFNYKFANKYYLCCCSGCHMGCKGCVLHCAARKIKKRYLGTNIDNDYRPL